MFRNNYDSDSVTYSPQGRIFQVEYACEAVKQGSTVVAIAGKDYVVLAALKRNAEELSSYQKKVKTVANHAGVGFAGLSADARRLSLYLEQQAAQNQQRFARPMSIKQMAYQMATVMQSATQSYGSRPYGAGFLLCGYDATGTHLFEIQPSAHYTEMACAGIGARSQMARTYLERHLDEFANEDKLGLIKHAVKALRDSLSQDKSLTVDNTSIAVVGKDHAFRLYEGQDIQEWLEAAADGDEDTLSNADGEAQPETAPPAGAEGESESRMDVDS